MNEGDFDEEPMISFIFQSQTISIKYSDFSKRSNYQQILNLPHPFKIEFPENEKTEVVKSIISFIQEGELIISKEYAFELFDQSQKLLLYKLSQFSLNFISGNFTNDEVIIYVYKQYSNRKDISSFQYFFSKKIVKYATCPLFYEKLPIDFIINVFKLGHRSITPDDCYKFSIEFYRRKNYDIETLQMFEFVDLQKISRDNLTELNKILKANGKPFPFYNLAKCALSDRMKMEKETKEDIHIYHLKAKLHSLSRTLYQQVINNDPTDACLLLSSMYESGNLPEASEAQIFRNFVKIADSNSNPKALQEVAERYEKGKGTKIDMKKSIEYYERASKSGSKESTIKLAHIIAAGYGNLKPGKEFELVSNAARLNDKNSLFSIGNYYKIGHGCKKSNLRAIHFFNLAGMAGCDDIESIVKPLLATVNSQTEKEAKAALEFSAERSYQIQESNDLFQIDSLKLAADSDYIRAIAMYSKVLINMRRYEEADKYCQKLINYDSREGYNIIGTLLKSKGEFEKAFNLFNIAAGKFNSPQTFIELSIFFKNGWIVSKDPNIVDYLMGEAAKLGDEFSMIKIASKRKDFNELSKLSKTSNMYAKFKYGKALLYGKIDGKIQVKNGLALIREAADNGLCEACFLCGKFLYETLTMNGNEFMPKDTSLAMKYLMKCVKRNAFYVSNESNKIKTIRIDDKTNCIVTFYSKTKEIPKYFEIEPHGTVFIGYILIKNSFIEVHFVDSIEIIKSMVYFNNPSYRYKAGSLLLNPTIFNRTKLSQRLADQKTIEKLNYEAFCHLRQSSDAGSLCGMFRYAYNLLFEKDDINDNKKNIFYNVSIDEIKVNDKRHYKEAMDLFLRAGLEGLDISLYFYSVIALTYPDLVCDGLSFLKYLAFEKNHSLSKTALGIYFYNLGEFKMAINYLKDNAYNKDRAAEYYYGRMLMLGQGIKEDKSLALNFLRLSADKGFKLSQVMLINTLVEMKDQIQLRSYLEPKMYDDSYVMYKFSSLLFDNFFDTMTLNNDIAIDLLKTSSLLNDSDGLWKFGTLLRDGFMVAKNESEAFCLFEKSSNLGNPSGKVCYANYLAKTKPAVSDDDNGNSNCLNLDRMKKNRVTAFMLFKQSYENGNLSGAWCYANCLMRGIGCEIDQLKALSIFINLATKYNDMNAQYQVFKMLMNGVMIDKRKFKSQTSSLSNVPSNKNQTNNNNNNDNESDNNNNNNNNDNNNNNESSKNNINNDNDNNDNNNNDNDNNNNNNNNNNDNNNNNNDNNNNDNNNSFNDGFSVNVNGNNCGNSSSYVFVRHKKKALEYLITAANNGHSTAQCRLGEYLLSGMFFKKKDWKAALHFFKLSAEKGNHRGINNYVKCLIEGHGGFQKDISTAVDFLAKLCANHKTLNGNSEFMYGSILIDKMNQIEEGKKYIMRSALELGNSDGLWKLGELYMKGIGFEKDFKKAKEYFTQSKDKGNKTGLFKLSEIILYNYKTELTQLITNDNSLSSFNEHESKEIKEGFELLEKAANLLQPEAQLSTAYLMFYGVQIKNIKNEDVVFIKKDISKAIKTFQLVADRDNNAEAMFMFGTLTNDFNYISRSARLRNDKARISYGKMCFNMIKSNDVEKDEKLAVYYFKLIADSGNAEAQYLFAICLMKGQGIERDESRALKYFKMAAEQGFTDAQYEYGKMIIQPDFVLGNQQRFEEGIRHLKAACDKGNNDAMYEISVLEKNGKMLLEAASKGSKKAISKVASSFYLSINNDNNNDNKEHAIFYDDSDEESFDFDLKISRKESFVYLQKAAEFDPKCAFYYGMCLRNGIEVEKDQVKAFEYIKKSYENGFKKKAAAVLGLYYLGQNEESDNEATFIEKDTNKAFALFNESFDSNDSFGTNCYGYCFYKGIEKSLSFSNPDSKTNSYTTENQQNSVTSNNSSTMKNAVHYFKVAYIDRNPSGINNYAVAMFQGNSIDGSPFMSISIFTEAAAKGCYTAVLNLRKIYSPECPYPSDLIPKMEMREIDELEATCNKAKESDLFHAELAIKI